MAAFDIFMVNAFGLGVNSGNPAGVCFLDEWYSTNELQSMATQLNLNETAFIIPCKNNSWSIRFFSVKHEIDVCGHTILAAAHCLFENFTNQSTKNLDFISKSGYVSAEKHSDGTVEIFLPKISFAQSRLSKPLVEGLGAYPEAVWKGINYLCLFDSRESVVSISPDFSSLKSLSEVNGVIVTAVDDTGKFDFVSRYFAPRIGINEDYATGSAHCMLVPFWSHRLRKTSLHSFQASSRGGQFWCKILKDSISLRGNVEIFLSGKLYF